MNNKKNVIDFEASLIAIDLFIDQLIDRVLNTTYKKYISENLSIDNLVF
tara:strand:- start:558 stop:704 length:147 start_codon:yes stop_codon:yes gene_type:complete